MRIGTSWSALRRCAWLLPSAALAAEGSTALTAKAQAASRAAFTHSRMSTGACKDYQFTKKSGNKIKITKNTSN